VALSWLILSWLLVVELSCDVTTDVITKGAREFQYEYENEIKVRRKQAKARRKPELGKLAGDRDLDRAAAWSAQKASAGETRKRQSERPAKQSKTWAMRSPAKR